MLSLLSHWCTFHSKAMQVRSIILCKTRQPAAAACVALCSEAMSKLQKMVKLIVRDHVNFPAPHSSPREDTLELIATLFLKLDGDPRSELGFATQQHRTAINDCRSNTAQATRFV